MNEATLRKLWNGYARAGYENIYQVHIQRDHLHNLGNLFLPSDGGIYLDLGCGTGNMFNLIVEKIQPAEVHAIDWSEEMLKKARLKAEVLAQDSDPIFRFYLRDISGFLDWPDNFFDGREFLREPITSLRGLKYRRIVAKISKKLEKHGAQFPSRRKLIDFLKALGFEEVEIVQTYWGGGVALRARLVSKPLP